MKLLCDLGLLKVILNTYAQKSSEKERLIDIFLLFTVFVFLAVVGNYIVLGEFPYNAFLGAIFCCLGIFSATLALRLRISRLEKKSDGQKKIPQSKRSSILSKTPRTAHQKQSNTRHTKIFHHKIESNKMKDKDKKAC